MVLQRVRGARLGEMLPDTHSGALSHLFLLLTQGFRAKPAAGGVRGVKADLTPTSAPGPVRGHWVTRRRGDDAPTLAKGTRRRRWG